MIASISKEKIITAIESLRPIAQYLTRNLPEADELIEATLRRSVANQDCYQGDISIKAWLYTVMRNIYVNDERCKGRFINIHSRAPIDYYDFYAIQNGNTRHIPVRKMPGIKNIIDIIVCIFPDVIRFKLEFYYLGYKCYELIDYLKGRNHQVERYEEQQPFDIKSE